MHTVYLDPALVPSHLRMGYSGKKFTATLTESVTIPNDAGLWDSGSRDTYSIVQLATGRAVAGSDNSSAPWTRQGRDDRRVTLAPGVAVVRHSIFCGKDMGLTFYLHPQDAARLLPAPVTVTADERAILRATHGYKSSYGGEDRYSMSRRDGSHSMTRAQWDATKAALIARNLLNKAGAITTAGKNALNAPAAQGDVA